MAKTNKIGFIKTTGLLFGTAAIGFKFTLKQAVTWGLNTERNVNSAFNDIVKLVDWADN